MDTSLIGAEAVDLLSRITGQKLSQRELTPPVIFLTALVTVLLGVMLADGTVTDEEKQRWQKTITQFIPPEDNARQLTQLLSKGIRQNQVYKKLKELLTLTAPLSESERLLLIGFGYEMSAADGDMDTREKKYLEAIANRLGINPQHLAVLEAGFSGQGSIEPAALDEVQFLLDPARFHELDTIFVKAASDMLAALSAKPEHKATQQQRVTSYQQLQDFQNYRQQLSNFCNQIFQIIQDCSNSDFLPQTLTEEIGKASRKLQSKRFRVAVVGEFSQGKSTLLNALLGADIQPVRAIPCSGTVTILRYGIQKRVVCRYKDGREEEIPIDQYKVKAAIPKEAARDYRTNELGNSEIDEIIFEHPDLDLCRSGVEIIDSPGLNEHPERSAITQKLLKDTDAAIFLTNAMRLLSEKEQELIQDVRFQLNGVSKNDPADNLFVLVNFMDLLDEEEDRQDVIQRLEGFVKEKNLLSKTENRIHYISAKAALKAIVKGDENEYLKAFQVFTQSIEQFLTVERGSLEIKQAVTKINDLIQASFEGLHQAEDVLDGKLELSETEKQNILEQIGEASGRDVKIQILANELVDEVIEEVNTSWDEWIEGLTERLAEKLEHWSSEHSAIWSRDELVQDYTRQFNQDLSAELDDWIDNHLKRAILKPKMEILEYQIRQELQAIKSDMESINQRINTTSSNWVFHDEGKYGVAVNIGILENIGLAGLGAALLIPAVIFAGPIIAFIGSLVGGGLLGTGVGSMFDLNSKVKVKVFEVGLEKFVESLDDTFEKINEIIAAAFSEKVEQADNIISKAISFYENLLEQQEKAQKETQQQREAEIAWISQKRQELEQLQKQIKTIIPA